MRDCEDIRAAREILRRFTRVDLEKTARDYIGFRSDGKEPAVIDIELIPVLSDEELRKFIHEDSFPGSTWRKKRG